MKPKTYTIDKINWEVPPPTENTPWCPILSPKGANNIRCIIVSHHILGVETHFIRGRTKPCIGKDNGCEGCQYNLVKRWKGYLGAWSEQMCRYALAEITHAAAVDLGPLIADRTRSLRGMWCIMERRGQHRNAPVKVTIQPRPVNARGEVPAEFDVQKALLRVWERNTDEKPADEEEEYPSEIPE